MKQPDSRLMFLAGGLALLTGWVVPIGANLIMLARRDPLVRRYRASLTYTSAVVGDGLHLPLLNMLIADHLQRHPARRDELLKALAVGGGLTTLAHIGQAASGGTNWQMQRPWHWSILGYEHYLHQSLETSFIALYFGKAIARLRSGKAQPVDRTELTLASLTMLTFLLMLANDQKNG